MLCHLLLNFREEIKTKYEDKLQKEMAGLEYEVVSKVFKAITGRKITVPGNFMRYDINLIHLMKRRFSFK